MIDLGPISQPTLHPVAAKDSKRTGNKKSHQKREMILTPSRSNGDGALPHSGQCRDTNVFFVVKDKAVVLVTKLVRVRAHTLSTVSWAHHFIRHDEQIELLGERGYFFQFRASKNLPHGVMRRVDDYHLGARSDGGPESKI